MYTVQFYVCMHSSGGGSKKKILKIVKKVTMKTGWGILDNSYYQTSLVIVILNYCFSMHRVNAIHKYIFLKDESVNTIRTALTPLPCWDVSGDFGYSAYFYLLLKNRLRILISY